MYNITYHKWINFIYIPHLFFIAVQCYMNDHKLTATIYFESGVKHHNPNYPNPTILHKGKRLWTCEIPLRRRSTIQHYKQNMYYYTI